MNQNNGLISGLPIRPYAVGENLVVEEQSSTGELFVLVSGAVEVVKGGETLITTLTKPGSFIGEMSLLLGTRYTATVRAIEPTTCHVIEKGEAYLRNNSEVGLAVARMLAERLHSATAYLADIKRQYAGSAASLAVVDQVLDTLVHHQQSDGLEPGSERAFDPNEAT